MTDYLEQFLYIIKDVGFPIAMCIYFVAINNTTIKKNTEAIDRLTAVLGLKKWQ
jgi:hypothetical protein